MSASALETTNDVTPLYKPLNPHNTSTFRFLQLANSKFSLSLQSYADLYKWSTSELDAFWGLVWDFTEVVGLKGTHVVDKSLRPPANPPWFSEAKLNWAENMLRCRSEKTALIQATEPSSENRDPDLRRVSYADLYSLVADTVSALLLYGLKPGDRVASYCSNCIENVVACLATTAIGCIWVSAAADFGPDGVLERFEQVQPKLLFAADAVVYNARVHPHLSKVSTLLAGLSQSAQPKVIIIQNNPRRNDRKGWAGGWSSWEGFLGEGRERKSGRTAAGEIEWVRKGFDWPLWILFSSGTTGRPKPIVHRAGGMLLQSKKEFAICGDLKSEDVFFYYTTTGWMMWNFLISGLSIGCTLVLYDGAPLKDPSLLWKFVDDLGITIFGTSAKYLDHLSGKQKIYKPRERHNLATLRHIYSTGSPLAPPLFDYVYKDIHPNVLLASITGGTDICSLFAGMCSALPVYRGEIQCRLLGMAIESFTPTGTLAGPDEAGELVCLKPFPCMPLGFWPLPGYGTEDAVVAAQARYQLAYFEEYDSVWYHGDHVVITQSRAGNGGGLVMLGRSDGVLNPGGIRFGSAELYDVIDLCFAPSPTQSSASSIVDCLAVGQTIDNGADERVILFVMLLEGETLTPALEKSIKAEIRSRRSPRHVPAKIIQVKDIPYTLNGKRVEVPVKKIINGAPLSSVNPATLRNPECLAVFWELGQMLRSSK